MRTARFGKALIAGAALALLALPATSARALENENENEAGAAAGAVKAPAAEAMAGGIRGLAARVGPSVVAIEGRGGGFRGGGGERSGAGVVIDDRGHILTSAWVVSARTTSTDLLLPGGRRVKAKVVGRDEKAGVVLLEAEKTEGLVAAPLAPGLKALRRGQVVATFGNPFGTLTRDGIPAMSLGVVSGIYPMPGAAGRNGVIGIETDAAINPGSFGGPLVDARGRVVGIVSPAYRDDRWLGLAIPIDSAFALLAERDAGPGAAALAAAATPLPAPQEGEKRGLLGIFFYDDDETPGGAKVERLQDGSPAAKAGLKPGDKVVSLNGKAVKSGKDLGEKLASLKAGEKVSLEVEREGWKRGFEMVAAAREEPKPSAAQAAYLGIYLVPRDKGQGGVIDEVVGDSPAAKAGLKKGDVVLKADGKAVESLDAFGAILKTKKPGDEITLAVERDGWGRELKVKLGGRAVEGESTAAKPETPKPTPAPTPTPAPKPEPERGYLGVFLAVKGGALEVTEIVPDSPAAKAGLKVGDVITEIRAEGVRGFLAKPGMSVESARSYLAQPPGTKLTLKVEREGWERTLEVALGKRPQERSEAPAPRPTPTPTPTPTPAPAAKPGFLGVYVRENDEGQGVVVESTIPGSPAEKAGLKGGDVITAVEVRTGGQAMAQSVQDIESFTGALRTGSEGSKVTLSVKRGSEAKKLEATLAARPAEVPSAPPTPPATPTPPTPPTPPAPPGGGGDQPGYLGVQIDQMDDGSVIVADVVPGSAAEKAGIAADDIIREIGGVKVDSLEALREAMSGKKAGEKVAIVVEREGAGRKTIEVTLGARGR